MPFSFQVPQLDHKCNIPKRHSTYWPLPCVACHILSDLQEHWCTIYRCAKRNSGHLQKTQDRGVNFRSTFKISGISGKYPSVHISTQFFIGARWPSCHSTNSAKTPKGYPLKTRTIIFKCDCQQDIQIKSNENENAYRVDLRRERNGDSRSLELLAVC